MCVSVCVSVSVSVNVTVTVTVSVSVPVSVRVARAGIFQQLDGLDRAREAFMKRYRISDAR